MTQDIIQLEILCLLRDIQRNMRSRNSDSSSRGRGERVNGENGGNNGGGNGKHRHNHKTPNNLTFERRIKN